MDDAVGRIAANARRSVVARITGAECDRRHIQSYGFLLQLLSVSFDTQTRSSGAD
jgi:hypothetical protein